jgi:hypothetical protein
MYFPSNPTQFLRFMGAGPSSPPVFSPAAAGRFFEAASSPEVFFSAAARFFIFSDLSSMMKSALTYDFC